MSKLLLLVLQFYKGKISPLLGEHCRFYPSCSDYMQEAIKRYGAIMGLALGIERLLRCNPLCKGGHDPVP